MAEVTTLTQVMLGLEPYVLIRLLPGDDGEPVLNMEAGGGAEQEPMYMPLLLLISCEPEQSPLAHTLRELADSGQHDVDTLAALIDALNPEWKPFMFRS